MTATGPRDLEMTDAAGVTARLRRWVPLGAWLAASWRETGRIVGYRDEEDVLYPVCQFDAAGLPLLEMRKVIVALRPVMGEAAIVGWLGTGCTLLGGARPADLLGAPSSAAVGEAARATAREMAQAA
ncbi:hypothetical protein [Limimaricola hongkongensis]|uniref:Antitoxin Xre/MbcA/ParS-like toxin-binding domain-containing protein n=1 Tax=Limimaricola hongkongensis DSM 17492 TaxID=1122180 RepID=A0A017H9Z3_9RHOB|nr:hypothetical protein [Limimaricola hongkongensis]EYD70574.1 hypothetical protein Lokhon_02214 [Limimaricola hongkongensis DSM 17492]